MLFSYVSNIFIKYAFISKTRANSAKTWPLSESAHLIYPKTVEISWAKICVLTTVINSEKKKEKMLVSERHKQHCKLDEQLSSGDYSIMSRTRHTERAWDCHCIINPLPK